MFEWPGGREVGHRVCLVVLDLYLGTATNASEASLLLPESGPEIEDTAGLLLLGAHVNDTTFCDKSRFLMIFHIFSENVCLKLVKMTWLRRRLCSGQALPTVLCFLGYSTHFYKKREIIGDNYSDCISKRIKQLTLNAT